MTLRVSLEAGMKRIFLTTVATAAITATSAAIAADLPRPGPAGPPGFIPPPMFSWTGCYLGASVGLGQSHTQWQDVTPDGNIDMFTTSNRTAHTNGGGGVFGGQLGCDWQVSNNWVLGLQGTVHGADINSTQQNQLNFPWSLTNNVDWYSTLTGRVGWAMNNFLIYGKGGFAWADSRMEVQNSGVTIFNGSTTRTGWTIGTGVEWGFAPNWSAFAEFNYLSFGNTTNSLVNNVVMMNGEAFGGANAPFAFNTKMQMETFMVGLNYRFRGW